MTNKEVVSGFYEALDNEDFARAEALLGPQHQMYSTMSPEPMNAAQHVGMSEAFKGFTDQRHEILDWIEAGNKVVMRAVWHGRHTGDFNGIPATGNQVDLSFITIVEVENGTMARQWIEMDGMSLMKQVGAM